MKGAVINRLDVLINPPEGMLGSVNAIYSGRSRRHLVENYAGPLSVKTMISGAAFWHTEAGAQRVQASSFLVLNKGTKYTLEIKSREPSHTFVLFFRNGFVEDVQRCLSSSGDALLDHPLGSGSETPFIEAIHSAGESAVGAALDQVRRVWLRGGSAAALEEEFRRVAVELVRLQDDASRLISAASSLRPSTRNELFRRTQRARVRIADSYLEDLCLEDLAEEACLSPYYFHRTFRELYGVTPHQYVQRLRLKKAARFLQETDLPIAAVCAKSGFESVPSFSTLFHSRFRMTPSRFRGLARKSKIR
jgi:AraC family transcriptional regulator